MTCDAVIDLVCAILAIFGSDTGDFLNQQLRLQPQMSVEEERLQRFWHDYYDCLRRYYGMLDRLDWVAYYKNHGYQINTGCGPNGGTSRIQFAPVFVSPQMNWAVPNTNLSGTPCAPGCPPGAMFPNYQSNQEPKRTWTLEVKVVEASSSGVKDSQCLPRFTTEDMFAVRVGSDEPLQTGTVQDLVVRQPGHTVRQAAATTSTQVFIGTAVQGKITSLSPTRVRIDLTLEKNELDSAGKDRLLIAGRTYRLAQQLQTGQRTKVVLQHDAGGEAKFWLELLVTEQKASSAEPEAGVTVPLPYYLKHPPQYFPPSPPFPLQKELESLEEAARQIYNAGQPDRNSPGEASKQPQPAR